MIFEKLLMDDGDFVMCVYPPCSGKSTIAELLQFYLSRNGMPEEIQTWLNTYEFQKAENIRAQADVKYQKFRSSSPFVLYLDFSEIEGKTREWLEKSYAEYLLRSWRNAGLPEDEVSIEKKLLVEQLIGIWSSLSHLCDEILRHFSGNLHIILDSLDNIHNLIAILPTSSSKELYSKFTKDVLK